MPIPGFGADGCLPEGIHTASLAEVLARFGSGSAEREVQGKLLEHVIEAAKRYSAVKRVLVWGSFPSNKLRPGDLDYSIVVSVDHRSTDVSAEHARFLDSQAARVYYGVDRGYLMVHDYPLDEYLGFLDFMVRDRNGTVRGIIEIHIRGEVGEAT